MVTRVGSYRNVFTESLPSNGFIHHNTRKWFTEYCLLSVYMCASLALERLGDLIHIPYVGVSEVSDWRI
jgi:hypothetical protein